jgi:DNA-binding NarL/FixJ family response regulator
LRLSVIWRTRRQRWWAGFTRCWKAIDPTTFAEFNYIEAVWNDYGKIAHLSPRECEVAVRIGLGMDAREIAQELTRSLDTVTSHKKAVYAKLDCDSQLKAALIIRRAGLTHRDVPRIARLHAY